METLPVQPRNTLVPFLLFIIFSIFAAFGAAYIFFSSTNNQRAQTDTIRLLTIDEVSQQNAISRGESVVSINTSTLIDNPTLSEILGSEDENGSFSNILEGYELDKIIPIPHSSSTLIGIKKISDEPFSGGLFMLWYLDKDTKEEKLVKEVSLNTCESVEWSHVPEENGIRIDHLWTPCEAMSTHTLYFFDNNLVEKFAVAQTSNSPTLTLYLDGVTSTTHTVSLIFDNDCTQLPYPIETGKEWKDENIPTVNLLGLKISHTEEIILDEKMLTFSSPILFQCEVGYGESKENPAITSIKYTKNQITFGFNKYVGIIDLDKIVDIFEHSGPYGISVEGTTLK